jgi:hypothetical protein
MSGPTDSSNPRKQWKAGDLCRLVDLPNGKVYDDAVVDTVHGEKATVFAGDRRWSVRLSSGLLQERPK